ncbi:c-type cytochrome [Aestuariibius sp. 2305UL40-4]|uniref:c-type cytochrome n=1 Tax=Aestuariibius violaceus TaxID=3234132 RepID=UPI00345E264A
MSKYLKIFAPAGFGAASVLALAYVIADQVVVDMPAPVREAIAVAPATAQEAPAEPEIVQVAESRITAAEGGYGLGRAALPEEVAAWDIDIRPDGSGLPEGSGDVWTGEEVFVAKCASCHGDFGEAVGRWPVLAGGQGSLESERPVKTIGSYWPYLSTVFDYVHRAMPFGEAQSLTPDEVYAITAYLLYLNDVVDDDFELSHENFAEVELPNQENFFLDDRAETELARFSAAPCMDSCKDSAEITMRAAVLDVTPDAGVVTEDAAMEEPVAEAPAIDEAAAEGPDPELIAEGEGVFRKCSACHQVGDGARNRSGPTLNRVLGHPAGAVDGFRYSPALIEAAEGGLVWTEDELAAFLAAPKEYLPKTKMTFRGLASDDEIDAVIAYLRSVGE